MPRPGHIDLPDGTILPILHEDRSVIALDKPAGWMLAPDSWTQTGRNLQLVLERSLHAGDFWARSRGLKFIRFVHRLDAETSGILLMVKSRGALKPYSDLFQSRQIEKRYLAIVQGIPEPSSWTCRLPIAEHPTLGGRMQTDRRAGKPAETHFRVLQVGPERALVEARPVTGRTHQIRVHLAAAGHFVLGDPLYGRTASAKASAAEPASPGHAVLPLALRAVGLAYRDPFRRRLVRIDAPVEWFVRSYGFQPGPATVRFKWCPSLQPFHLARRLICGSRTTV